MTARYMQCPSARISRTRRPAGLSFDASRADSASDALGPAERAVSRSSATRSRRARSSASFFARRFIAFVGACAPAIVRLDGDTIKSFPAFGLEIDEARLPALLVYRARALVRAEFAADVADADAVEDLLDGCL